MIEYYTVHVTTGTGREVDHVTLSKLSAGVYEEEVNYLSSGANWSAALPVAVTDDKNEVLAHPYYFDYSTN